MTECPGQLSDREMSGHFQRQTPPLRNLVGLVAPRNGCH